MTLVACSASSEAPPRSGSKDGEKPVGPPSVAALRGARLADPKARAFTPTNAGLSAPGSALGARLEATDGRITLSYKGKPALAVGLLESGRSELSAVSGALRAGCADAAEREPSPCVQRDATSTIVEWWRNEADGLEHLFRLDAPPDGEAGLVRLRVGFSFADVTLRDDGQAVDISPVHGPAMSYEKLVVKDARGRVVPAHFEVAEGAVDIVFSDADARYPILVDPTLVKKTSARTWEGRDTGAFGEFGWSVASAGDVNGDGYDDVLVGTGDVRTDGVEYGSYVSGRIFLFLGGPEGPTTSSWTAGWNAHSGGMATATGIGDIDGDGHADVAVYAHFGSGDESDRKTSIYLGSKAGLRKDPSAELPHVVYPVGDVDGDKHADLAEVVSDVLVLRYGGKGGLSDRAEKLALEGAGASAWGPVVSDVVYGDFDGDGRTDIAVGLPMSGDAEEGRVLLYLNGPSGLPTSPTLVAIGDGPKAHFGATVRSAGRVYGRERDDLLVASTPDVHRANGESVVALYRVYAEKKVLESAWKASGKAGLGFVHVSDKAPYTTVMAGVGDVDGDGFGDVVLGAPNEPNALGGTGEAYLYLGSADGLAEKPAVVFALPNNDPSIAKDPSVFLGHAVAGAGDVDGDGVSDILIAADSFSSRGQEPRRYASAAGGLVCLNDCGGKRAPNVNVGRRIDSGCVIKTAFARDPKAGPTRACGQCTASQLQLCGFRRGACNDELGMCQACDANLGGAGAAPCRNPSQPVCATVGPNTGACRAACDANYGSKSSRACAWAAPFCASSGDDAGRCLPCDADFGGGTERSCGASRPVCAKTGSGAGSCGPRPRPGRATNGLESEGGFSFLRSWSRRLRIWWSRL